MMDYEVFKEVVAQKIMEYMPERFQGFKPDVRKVRKVNEDLDCFSLHSGDKIQSYSPNIYIRDMYNVYLEHEDLEATLKYFAKQYEERYDNIPQLDINMEDARENIIMCLVNTEANKEMLADMPHREFHDTSVIYRWVMKIEEDGIASSMIFNDMMEQLGIDESELFKVAVENTTRLLQPKVVPISQVIIDTLVADGMPEEIAEMMIDEVPKDCSMWVITNEKGINGAVNMLYEKQLHALAESIGDDLYLLPSSIHEVIAVPAKNADIQELSDMVYDANMGVVAVSERLSNEVYHYDKDLRKLTMATDSPNKSITGGIVDTAIVYEAESKKR